MITGKINKIDNIPTTQIGYKNYYYSNPCVPIDFLSITEAIKYCSTSEHSFITLFPGIYYEQINIERKNITIKASNSEKGARIAYHDDVFLSAPNSVNTIRNQPCIKVSGENTKLKLIDIQVLHSSLGADIWGGKNIPIRFQVLFHYCLSSFCFLNQFR